MSDYNEEQVKAKDARRGITEQRGNVHAKKKKVEPGQYILQQRVRADSALARYMKQNPWVQYRELSWSDFDEVNRVGNIFARKNRPYEYRILDTTTNTVHTLKGN